MTRNQKKILSEIDRAIEENRDSPKKVEVLKRIRSELVELFQRPIFESVKPNGN